MTQRDTDPPANGDPLDQQLQSQPYYPAAVRPPAAQASTWHGEVPDLPGCVVAGVTLEDAMVRLVEAMQAALADLERRAAEVPEPSLLDAWARSPDHQGWLWFLIQRPPPTDALLRAELAVAEVLPEVPIEPANELPPTELPQPVGDEAAGAA